jgi:hypothetical protein
VSLWAYSAATGWFQPTGGEWISATVGAGSFNWSTTAATPGWYAFGAYVWDGSASGYGASPDWLEVQAPPPAPVEPPRRLARAAAPPATDANGQADTPAVDDASAALPDPDDGDGCWVRIDLNANAFTAGLTTDAAVETDGVSIRIGLADDAVWDPFTGAKIPVDL